MLKGKSKKLEFQEMFVELTSLENRNGQEQNKNVEKWTKRNGESNQMKNDEEK